MSIPFKYVFIYSTFLITISFWGHFLSLLLQKRNGKISQKSSFINKLLKSFTIGLSTYILAVYLFITIWNFNPFTGYYFFLIFDIICFVYFYGERTLNFLKRLNFEIIRKNSKNLIRDIRESEEKKRKMGHFLSFFIFIFIIISFFNWQYAPIIYSSTAHFYYDPYIWESYIYHLLRNNTLNYEMLGSYPAGFIFFVAGIFSQTWNENLYSIHMFNKSVPGLILLTNFLLLLLIFWEIFHEKKFISFLPSIILFTSSYFLYRSFFLIPTTLVSIFTILLMYLIYNKEIPKYYQGFVLGAIILTHPYNGVIITIVYIFYILYEGFFQKILHLKHPKRINLKEVLRSFISSYFIPIMVIGIMIFTFIVHLMLNIGVEWINGYLHYFNLNVLGNIFLFFQNIFNKLVSENSFLLLPNSKDIITIFSNSDDFNSTFLVFIKRSIGYNYIVFFIIVLAIIFPMSKIIPEKYHSIIRFSRVFLLITVFIYFSSFLETYVSPLFQLIYFVRGVEMNTPIVSFLFGMGIYIIHFIYEKLLISIKGLIQQYEKKKKNHISKMKKNIKSYAKRLPYLILYTFLIINIGSTIFLVHFEKTFKFTNSYDQFLFTFRTYQDDTMSQFENTTLHYCREDTNLHFIVRYYFSWDHEYKANYWNGSLTKFEDLITNTTKLNDIIILSDLVSSYYFIQQNISMYGEVIYNRTNIIAVRRTFI